MSLNRPRFSGVSRISPVSSPFALPDWIEQEYLSGNDGRAWNAHGGQRRRLLLVSNRGPVEYTTDAATGAIEARQGAGGVVSGLLSALKDTPATWIALAMNNTDRAVARAHAGAFTAPASLRSLRHLDLKIRLVDVPEDTYQRYYERISNRVLWFTQHYLLKQTSSRLFTQRTLEDWEKGYRAVNEAVAQAALAELDAQGADTPVLFQDYHLYLASEFVRQRRPQAKLAHFTHIPWPEARYWELLPAEMTQAIFRGLAANDVIGFQTLSDARNFLMGVERFLPGAQVRMPCSEKPG
ncbi:MAG TPA: trehalose-6-phosphate synthase, partial [Ktedonobacterales bacterium]|nr:trehalose-6-phosphate synthase [Ktedonobacterales bacterium]